MGRRAKLKKARTQVLTAAKAKKKSASGKSKPDKASSYTVEELMAKAEKCMDSFQMELACKFCERALEVDSNNLSVLDTFGPLLLEIGQTDRAVECFKRSIDLSPLTGHSKYLYLGQLSEGEVAIGYIQKGIDIMTKSLERSDGGASVSVMCEGVSNEDLSNAYCSLAEVYLTDSCFLADAGTLCHEACVKALEFAPNNAEALQIQASCLLSLDRKDEARQALVKSVLLWLQQGSDVTDDDITVMSSKGGEDVPPYWSRVNTAKLLLEMEEYEMAFRVLEGLLKDDDEVIAVWYLMGWLYCLTKDADSARFYLEQAMTLFTKHDSDEVDILEHTKELLQELGQSSEECDCGGGEEEESIDDCEATMDIS